MNCKECKGKGFYQPLIGPPEPCQACFATRIKRLVPIDLLQVIKVLQSQAMHVRRRANRLKNMSDTNIRD